MSDKRDVGREKSRKEAVYRSVGEFKQKFFPKAYEEEISDQSPADRAMGAGDAGESQAKESLKNLQSRPDTTQAKRKSR